MAKETKSENLDQADVLAQNETLTTENTRLVGENETLITENARLVAEVATLTSARDEAVTARESADAEVQTLTDANATLTTTNETLSNEERDFEASVAAKVKELGIEAAAAETPVVVADKPKSLTEQALEARESK